MNVPAHKEHMFALLIAIIVISILSYLLAWRAFNATTDPQAMLVPIFALCFLNTALLVILTSFLLKVYEHVHK